MIEVEEHGIVSVLRMVRGKGNALNLELVESLLGALDSLERSPARAAILTGQGGIFCAGVDLVTLCEGGADYVRRFLPRLGQLFERLVTFPKPLVAAANGHAIAGGAIILLACDQRLLARGNARVGLTEILVGVVFPAWALEIARFATPPQHFTTLVCTGRTWPAEEALARGLVDEIGEPERLLNRACAVAEELAAIPAATFAATKMAVRRPLIEAARQQAEQTDAAVLERWCASETLRQVEGYVESTLRRRS
jgi:enoyl-CoA hydratase